MNEPETKLQDNHEERLAALEDFIEKVKRMEVQINGSNGAVIETKDNLVIRVGVQT